MALLLKRSCRSFYDLLYTYTDPRADDYYLMSSPLIIIGIACFYLYLINVLKDYMKNREPYDLKNIILVYNGLQVICNTYIAFEAFRELSKMSLHCSPLDYSRTPSAMHVLRIVYFYFITRLFDTLDTVFFLLRKKSSHVTFLHTYHHFGMVILSWFGVKVLGGGHSIYLGAINSLVHAFMYSYYFLSAIDSKYKNYTVVKKFITQIQLIQHGLIFLIYSYNLMVPNCTYPKYACYFMVPQSLFMVALFGEFYYKAYVKPESKKIE